MAMPSSSCSLLLLLFLFSTLLHAHTSPISLPLSKDPSSLQYLTTLSFGTPLQPSNLVLDLSGSLPWLHCSSPSSSLSYVFLRSLQCLTAQSPLVQTQTFSHPSDQDQPCLVPTENTITGKRVNEGELVQDLVPLHDSRKVNKIETLFACSPTSLLNGLASGARGMLGISRSRTSFSSQLFHSLSISRKITFCLSPSSGVLLFGDTGYESQPGSQSQILRSLTFTPLLNDQDQTHPSINVNSVKINGKKVSFNTPSLSQEGNGVAQLSTVVPYTTLQSSIYEKFESAFLRAALSMGMAKVDPVAPFGLCFGPSGLGGSHVGPDVPVIELVLQSEMVKWSMYGRNSMVKVSDEVMCLGFLDGGLNPKSPIVIGGHQLEDVLVQFDLDTSMVGFSSSLLMRDSSCSDFKASTLPTTQSV